METDAQPAADPPKDRKTYNGIEHFPNMQMGLAHYRTLDAGIGRWLQVDPEAEAQYGVSPYCSMNNNPISLSDPEGDLPILAVMGIYGALNLGLNAINGNVNSFGEGLLHFGVGAVNGALSTISPLKVPFSEGSSFGLSLAPQIAVGTDGIGFGFNATAGYQGAKGFNAGLNFGGSFYTSAPGTGQAGFEGRLGYGLGYQSDGFQAGIGSTFFASGETSQLNGQIYAGGGNWKLTYENDTWAPVPGLLIPGGADRDRFRTAALQFEFTGGKLEGAKAGMRIFTGLADNGVDRGPGNGPNGTFAGPGADRFRMGAVFVGYKNYRIGYNSERNIRGPIQNGFHDLNNFPRFRELNIPDRLYGGIYSSNPYTLWP